MSMTETPTRRVSYLKSAPLRDRVNLNLSVEREHAELLFARVEANRTNLSFEFRRIMERELKKEKKKGE